MEPVQPDNALQGSSPSSPQDPAPTRHAPQQSEEIQLDKEELAVQPVEVYGGKDGVAEIPDLQGGDDKEVAPAPEPTVPISIRKVHRRSPTDIELNKLCVKS